MLAGLAGLGERRMSEEDLPRTRSGPDRQDKELTGEQLFATLYADLRRMADRELVRNRGMTVSPTTLVHEAYVKLSGRDGVKFPDRGKFLGYAARAMRTLLIDLARRRQALKRGAGFHITQINTQVGDEAVADSEELTQLSEALDELATHDARLAEVVDLKYFCGFSFTQIAQLRGISERTVQRDWEKARLILFRHIGAGGS
jgi:RNA polymerase sigma factor (TIGR02999 family)